MHGPHVTSGGPYPVLRALGIFYVIGAAGVLCYGLYRIGFALFAPPGWVADRLTSALAAFALTAAVVVTSLVVAELIKLLIDIQHNTRAMGNGHVPPAPVTYDRAEESAEAALIRGH
jgi:hypothetical protein